MSSRSWFYASQGQQQGPYPEIQLRDFIARGIVTADTLVWSEGMSGWQKAGEIPGLMSGVAVAPVIEGAPGPFASASGHGGGPLSFEPGIWDLTWRSLVVGISLFLVIPLPWAGVMYSRWIVSCARVPQRPNLTFTGRPVELMWYYAAVVVLVLVSLLDIQWVNALITAGQILLYWLAIKWFVANISSDGQPPALGFSGSFWGYLGWNILAFISVITIIGWAWVYAAQTRWMCRHIEGTRREVVFNGTGLEILWRSVAALFGCIFIVTIPWVMRWYARWYVSQVALVERSAAANA